MPQSGRHNLGSVVKARRCTKAATDGRLRRALVPRSSAIAVVRRSVATGCNSRGGLAMQKVEGSSPFSRFQKAPQSAGFSRGRSAVIRSRLGGFGSRGYAYGVKHRSISRRGRDPAPPIRRSIPRSNSPCSTPEDPRASSRCSRLPGRRVLIQDLLRSDQTPHDSFCSGDTGPSVLRHQTAVEFAGIRHGQALRDFRDHRARAHARTTAPHPPAAADPTSVGSTGSHPASAGATSNRVETLERLAALRANGALTDDEFAAEKALVMNTSS